MKQFGQRLAAFDSAYENCIVAERSLDLERAIGLGKHR
jgi:hypothetical protein